MQNDEIGPVEAQKAAAHTSLDMTMLCTQTEEPREREHVGKILERLGLAKTSALDLELQKMKPRGGV